MTNKKDGLPGQFILFIIRHSADDEKFDIGYLFNFQVVRWSDRYVGWFRQRRFH